MQRYFDTAGAKRIGARLSLFPRSVALVLWLTILVPMTSWGGSPTETLAVPSNSDARSFRKGVVAAAHPLATEAGARVLENGGNAIDAAAAVQFVLNVVEPTSSGIGGGGFMEVHLADQNQTFLIDSREKTPAAGTATMFLKCDPNCDGSDLDRIGSFTERATSGIAVGVPGTLLGVSTALKNWGTISLAEALQPAITLADDGFNINARLASLTASSRTTFQPETRALFRLPDGSPLPEGHLLVQPDLAKTFRMIAEQGPLALYTGAIAEALVVAQERYRTEVGPQGAGRMTTQDLVDYFNAGPDIREPVVGVYRGITIKGMPSPSSGGQTVIQILKCLEQFPIGDEDADFGFGSTKTLHTMIESMRLAFASRSVWMGDTDFVQLPTEGLIADGYLNPRCAMIKADERMATPEAGDPRPFDPNFASLDKPLKIAALAQEKEGVNTTHFSVVDRWGNAVSYTSTIEGTWGSGIIVPGYGFLLNNELTDFNSAPTINPDPNNFNPGANDVAPFKRPRSSMSPVMLFKDGEFFAAYGSPGGSTIINSVVNMTLNIVDHGMSVQDAIDAPRVSQTSAGGSTSYEDGFGEDVLQSLNDLGHNIRSTPSVIGSVQAVIVDLKNGQQFGGADDRRAGTVIGLPRKKAKKN